MFRALRANAQKSVTSSLVVLAFALGLSGCADHRNNDNVQADSVLSHDLALANQATPQPTFEDTALSSTAKAPEPKPSPAKTPAPTRSTARRERTMSPAQPPNDVTPHPLPSTTLERPAPVPSRQVAAGTGIALTSGSKVCTTSNRPGDKIVATIDSPVTGSNGALIPAGSKAVLEVASITPGNTPEESQIVFRVRSLYVNDVTYNVNGNVTSSTPLKRVKIANPDANADKKKVIGGAIAGAILGQIIGHNTKGTVIGAATGAAAGAVAAKASEKYEACLPAGASLHVTLAQPVAM